jgi:hypothetical protein
MDRWADERMGVPNRGRACPFRGVLKCRNIQRFSDSLVCNFWVLGGFCLEQHGNNLQVCGE